MNSDVRLSYFTTICATCIGFVAGCQPKVDEPVKPSPANMASPDAAQAQAVPEAKGETEPAFEMESDFSLITISHFESFGTEPDTWKETIEGIACSGKPRGYLFTKQPYKNFTLRLDYRFPRPANLKEDAKFKGNTGFLIYITGEHKLWPTCIEVQGKNSQMAAIKENGGAEPVVSEDDENARQQARKSVGLWNSLEIVSSEGALKVSLNGTPISRSQPGPLLEGQIGIQSEDHPFEVRRMRIRME